MINEADRYKFYLAPLSLENAVQAIKKMEERHGELLLMLKEAKKKHRENKIRQSNACS